MKFEEALAAMREGKKVRTPHMIAKTYFTIHNDKMLFALFDGRVVWAKKIPVCLVMADDWQIVD